MLACPAARRTLIAKLRRVAMFSGPTPVRILEASSAQRSVAPAAVAPPRRSSFLVRPGWASSNHTTFPPTPNRSLPSAKHPQSSAYCRPNEQPAATLAVEVHPYLAQPAPHHLPVLRPRHRRRDQPRCCAVGECCRKLLSPLTLTYVHSVLKSALEHAVHEEEIPRNVARNVRTGTPRPRRRSHGPGHGRWRQCYVRPGRRRTFGIRPRPVRSSRR
jgi:hypothetical protein